MEQELIEYLKNKLSELSEKMSKDDNDNLFTKGRTRGAYFAYKNILDGIKHDCFIVSDQKEDSNVFSFDNWLKRERENYLKSPKCPTCGHVKCMCHVPMSI